MTNSERVSLRKPEVSQVRGKISLVALERLVRAGNGVSQIARKLGVAKSSVSKAMKKLRVGVAKDVALRSAPMVLAQKLDAAQQLLKINAAANELLDLLMRWIRGDQEALQILESQVRKIRVRDSEEEISEYRFKDPRELAFKAMAEIRHQIGLQHEIFQSLYSLQETARFREVVLGAIGAASPEVRERIVKTLAEQNIISSTMSLSLSLESEVPSVALLEERLRQVERMRKKHIRLVKNEAEEHKKLDQLSSFDDG